MKTIVNLSFRISSESSGKDRYTVDEVKQGIKNGDFYFVHDGILCDKTKDGKVVGQVEDIILPEEELKKTFVAGIESKKYDIEPMEDDGMGLKISTVYTFDEWFKKKQIKDQWYKEDGV